MRNLIKDMIALLAFLERANGFRFVMKMMKLNYDYDPKWTGDASWNTEQLDLFFLVNDNTFIAKKWAWFVTINRGPEFHLKFWTATWLYPISILFEASLMKVLVMDQVGIIWALGFRRRF